MRERKKERKIYRASKHARETGNEQERDLPSVTSLPEWPPWPGLSHVKAKRNQKLHPCLPRGRQGPKYLGLKYCCTLRCLSRELDQEQRSWVSHCHSDTGCWCCKQTASSSVPTALPAPAVKFLKYTSCSWKPDSSTVATSTSSK